MKDSRAKNRNDKMKLTEKKCYPWLLVLFYSMMGIFFPAAVTQYSMTADNLAAALNVSESVILLADTCRAVCLCSAMFLSGPAYRRFGLRKTMAIGIMFQILPQFLIPLAANIQSLPLLFVFKSMQGLNAVAFPLYISAITLWMDERYDAVATSVFNGSFTAGSGIGAFIAGKLIPRCGWQGSFYAIGFICLIMSIPVLLITRDKPISKTMPPETECIRKNKSVYKSIVCQPITWLLILGLLANTWVSQAVTVDMSVYANCFFEKGKTGTLMLIISVITVVSSVLGGAVSDFAAQQSSDRLQCRSLVMSLGYIFSFIFALLITSSAEKGVFALTLSACVMMAGASWAGGVFWSLPVLAYRPEDNVAGTAFLSAASNIPNPIAPMVVGVLLGGRGYWSAAWNTCALSSLLSFCAGIVIAVKTVSIRQTDKKEKRSSKKNQNQKKNRVSAHG